MSRREPTKVVPHHAQGLPLWRSLEDKDRTPEQRRIVAETEFAEGQTTGDGPHNGAPQTGAPETGAPQTGAPAKGSFVSESDLLRGSVSRRGFIQLSTAAAASASLAGCIRRPEEAIVPYGTAPEDVVPGVANHYATVTERRGDALGLLVTSHEGRPTKIEGNPQHPRSVGATDVLAQAMLMDLYDPDRAEYPTERTGDGHQKRSWSDFQAALQERLTLHDADKGAGLRFVVPDTASPSVARVIGKLMGRYPRAKLVFHDTLPRENLIRGVELAFGTRAFPVPLFHAARTIVALDSDFLSSEPGAVRATQLFSQRRRPQDVGQVDAMNRLYVVEPSFTITGGTADHRLPLPAQDVGAALCAIVVAMQKLVAHVKGLPATSPVRATFVDDIDLGSVAAAAENYLGASEAPALPKRWLFELDGDTPKGLVAELLRRDRRGASLITVGSRQPKEVQALAHALNGALGGLQRTIAFAPIVEANQEARVSFAELTKELEAGQVKTLMTLGVNPVYDAPADQRLTRELLGKAEALFSVASHLDETAQVAHWTCPLAHELEAWGDVRGIDGSYAIQQPTIRPLWHGARSALEVLALAAGESNWRGYGVVRRTFREAYGRGEQRWHSALHRGLVSDSGAPVAVTLNTDAVVDAVGRLQQRQALSRGNLEVNFLPCAKLLDGRHANNIWLQELPEPMTKLVWDNAALLSPNTAKGLGVQDGDLVRLSRGDYRVEEIAVMTQPGLPDWSITLTLGHGRGEQAGRYAHGNEKHGGGFDVYPLRTSDAPWFASGVTAESLGRRYMLTRTQEYGLMSGLSHQEPRAIVLQSDVEGYKAQPNFASYKAVDMRSEDPDNPDSPPPGSSLWQPVDYSQGHKWGMTIDLSACTGCNACVIACQAENNVPAVGKRQVARGREMYWLRIDRYFVGDDVDNPQIAVQPVACQHCEEAPCENVCPVNATVHGPEGMNNMAYNRCIGTRYCANNCPYKVRRFNYLAWHGYVNNRFADYDEMPQPQEMVYNPNVTVRYRGVMEKCSYCVQRVNAAKIEVKHRSATGVADEALPRDEAALIAVRDRLKRGKLQSACQQVCPAGAIRFGDLNDERSEVAQLAQADRQYALLAELGTRPRTSFLAKIRNPNPDLVQHEASQDGAGGHHEDGHSGHQESHG